MRERAERECRWPVRCAVRPDQRRSTEGRAAFRAALARNVPPVLRWGNCTETFCAALALCRRVPRIGRDEAMETKVRPQPSQPTLGSSLGASRPTRSPRSHGTAARHCGRFCPEAATSKTRVTTPTMKVRRQPRELPALFLAMLTAAALSAQSAGHAPAAKASTGLGAKDTDFALRTPVESRSSSVGGSFSLRREMDLDPRARAGGFSLTSLRGSSGRGPHCLCGDSIFADDFETGGTTRWSSTTP